MSGSCQTNLKCSYAKCNRPYMKGLSFKEIQEGKTSGGQDWSSLAGSVLCHACYMCFYKRGTLERNRNVEARRCTNEKCSGTHEGSKFLYIEENKTSGGQDCSSVVGAYLCSTCYSRFCQIGALEEFPEIVSARPYFDEDMTDDDSGNDFAMKHEAHRQQEPQSSAPGLFDSVRFTGIDDFFADNDDDGFEKVDKTCLTLCKEQSPLHSM
jgi:hypothetical protein